MRWYLIPSTIASRLTRLIDSAASSMNSCGFFLKSFSRLALGQDPHQAPARELRLILKIGQQVRELDVVFFDDDRGGD